MAIYNDEFLHNHIFFKAAYYLNDLHANKRFHGDLKPSNIFYDEITRDIITDSDSVTFLDKHDYEGDSNYDIK
jgi:serine/threonine protein kinase